MVQIHGEKNVHYMTLCGLVWPCVALCGLFGLVWPFLAFFGHFWPFVTLCDLVGPCGATLSPCMVFYGRISSFLAVIDLLRD